MACFGSKTLQRGARPRPPDLTEDDHNPSNRRRRKDKGKKNRSPRREEPPKPVRDRPSKKKKKHNNKMEEMKSKPHRKSSENRPNPSTPPPLAPRRKVDPETMKYFSEIAGLFEGEKLEIDERVVVCGNALEESRGKELELATDPTISHTLQILIEGCDLDHLCGFLVSSATVFPSMAMASGGSHVAETALKALAFHLQNDENAYSFIEDTLTKICKVVVVESVNLMHSPYGSHVLRSLLCLCKGVPLDSMELFHVTKSSTVLAERLSDGSRQFSGKLLQFERGFPELLKFIVREMLKHAGDDIGTLRANKHSSFVLQTVLKLLVGDDQELMHVIPIVLGCSPEDNAGGKFIEVLTIEDVSDLLNDTASSHLVEVIMEVAPEPLYDDILRKVFRKSLFEVSCHQCGNFVIQAMVSSVKSQAQMELIWEELGPHIKELLEVGKPGVVASLLAACQRLQTHCQESCRALAAAVHSESEPVSCIVPHILYLDGYFSCKEKTGWRWPTGDKMHVLGCLMLQIIFKYPSQSVQPYVTSILSMEAHHASEAAKDAGGGRVIEAFLISDASVKQKQKLIRKLEGHFGDLAMHPSGSFTVEKCFIASNVSLKEIIASEVLAMRPELYKMKHGPYILRKLDIDGFAMRHEQWKSSIATKQNTYRDFSSIFGSKNEPQMEKQTEPKRAREESDQHLHNSGHTASSDIQFSTGGVLKGSSEIQHHQVKRKKYSDITASDNARNKKFIRSGTSATSSSTSNKRNTSMGELEALVGKTTLNAGEVRKLFGSSISNKELQSMVRAANPSKKPRV
ncbi:hypothetical protein QJS04_geneDACA004824 [Acorus gramineus]|uniref:Pumilio homolog 23 n=1 Tax=Acorus gramineus TaxID=55184 RepID=A0AAV9BVG1_ACOGR|nr:hypothetical protein QJS04_geneDACA004824 [Acorus gramineus]